MGFLFLLVGIQLAPWAYCSWRRQWNFLALLFGGQFVGYSVGYLILVFNDQSLSPSASHAIQLLCVSSALFLVAHLISRRLLKVAPADQKENFSPFPVVAVGALSVMVSLVSAFLPMPVQSILALPLFLLFSWSSSASRSLASHWGWVLLCIATSLQSFLMTAHLGVGIHLAVAWLLGILFQKRTQYAVPLLLLAALLSVCQSLKGNFRQHVGVLGPAHVIQRAKILKSLLARQVESTESAREPSSEGGSWDRFVDLSLERVVELTPQTVPYWKGRSFLYLTTLLTPAHLSQSKGSWNLPNEFGKAYGFIAPDDTVTENVFSYFTEGYMNFGKLGMWAMALFMGVFTVLIERWGAKFSKELGVTAYSGMLLAVLSYQTDLSSLLLRVAVMALLLLAATHFARYGISRGAAT